MKKQIQHIVNEIVSNNDPVTLDQEIGQYKYQGRHNGLTLEVIEFKKNVEYILKGWELRWKGEVIAEKQGRTIELKKSKLQLELLVYGESSLSQKLDDVCRRIKELDELRDNLRWVLFNGLRD